MWLDVLCVLKFSVSTNRGQFMYLYFFPLWIAFYLRIFADFLHMIVLALSGLFHFINKRAHWAVWTLLKMSPLRYEGSCLWLSELNEGYPYGAPCGSEGASDQIMQWAGSWFNSLWLVFNSCRSQETSWMCTAVRAWRPPPSLSAAPALQTCKMSRESWPVCISVCGLPSLYVAASSFSFLWHRSFTS